MVEQLPPQGGVGDGAGRRADPRHITELAGLLGDGDLVVDGGNSVDRRPAERRDAGGEGVGFVDCGVSGGVWGLQNGYALMRGTDEDAKAQPALTPWPTEGGFAHAGQAPAPANFAKMVHNGIEYAIMQATPRAGSCWRRSTWSTTSPTCSTPWRSGTVIRSWLLDPSSPRSRGTTHLDKIAGYARLR